MDKFRITTGQIPETQAKHPANSTAHVWKPLCFTWKSYGQGRGCKIQFSSHLRHETASPSVYNHLPRSRYLFSLLPSRGPATPWQTHLWFITRADREGRWRITSRQTPSPITSRQTPSLHTGPGQPDEPGIFTAPSSLLCKLTDRVRLGREVVNV